MAYDEATASFVERVSHSLSDTGSKLGIEELRNGFERFRKLIVTTAVSVRAEDRILSTPQADIPLRLLTPQACPKAVLVYCHGGGWVMGSNDLFEPLCRELAERSGCVVVMVEYRKAPENPYPAAVDDAWQALEAVASGTLDASLAGLPLLIGGDSSGANLAAAVTLRERALGNQRLAGQLLIYPVLSADFGRESYLAPENQALLSARQMAEFWDLYVPRIVDRLHCEAAPLNAAKLSELPPAVLITAEHDVLRDEGEAYADKLAQAGIPVKHRRFAGQIHGFMMFVGRLPGSTEGIAFAADGVRDILDVRTALPK